ncbi:hypothetical protein ACHAW5_004323 [Stephanodiscus triporus]|uniref:Uncharacterized protein n=1 Tax=Stephanodiscus triporus TaxID=2934178 RepID=A0ABD3MXT0_9STRA
MTTSDDDRPRKKSCNNDGSSGRGRHESSRERTRHAGDDGGRGGGRGGLDDEKLTEEEARLYAKAREFVKREEEDGRGDERRHRRHHRGHGKESKRRRRRGENCGDSIDGDASRRRGDGKERKRDRMDDRERREESTRHHGKKSKRGHHRDEGRRRHKKEEKHGPKKIEGSFKDKASPVDASKLVSMGDIVHETPSERLDAETNYFSHSSHLRLFLYRKYGIYFEDLTSTESHACFDEFTKSYNAGELEEAYYNPSGLLPQEALDQCSRTKHNWKFRTNRLEEQSLAMVRAGVKKQTEYNDEAAATGKVCAVIPSRSDRKADDTHHPPAHELATDIAARRQSDKRHRERIELANEEIHGISRPDRGWERDREKRKERSEKLHGAARDREGDAWGGIEMDDDAIYGASGIDGRRGRGGEEVSYEEAVARERQRRERKGGRLELLAKEAEKQKNMLEMLGLSGVKLGEKITIAPRKDTA